MRKQLRTLVNLAAVVLLVATARGEIQSPPFGKTPDGAPVELFTL